MTVQQCTCGHILDHEECACSIRDTDWVTMDGSGSVLNPFVPVPVIDTENDDNLMSCEGDGLLVELPVWMTNPDRCQVTHSANQSIAHYTDETLAFDSENYDTATPKMHDNSDNERITIQTAGIYIITFVCAWVANATGGRQATIKKNGNETLAAVHHHTVSASFESALNVTAQEWLEVGDYITVTVKQYRGSALALVGGTAYSPILTVQFRRLPPNE